MERSFKTWDLLIAAGLAFALVALTLPWREERTCAPMQDCTPWITQTGWSTLGWGFVAGGAVLALAFAFLPAPARRGVCLGVALLGLLALTMEVASQDLRIFVESHGSMWGMYVAWAGVALVAFAALAGLASSRPNPGTPVAARRGSSDTPRE